MQWPDTNSTLHVPGGDTTASVVKILVFAALRKVIIVGTLGYCDIFSKCRSVDGEGPLSRLKNFLLNPVTLSKIRYWITVNLNYFNFLFETKL